MQGEASREASGPVLEYVDALPRSQCRSTAAYRDRQLGCRERRTDMGRHVVGPLGGVPVQAAVLGDDAAEEVVEIVEDVGVGVLLDRERRRRVTDEDGE